MTITGEEERGMLERCVYAVFNTDSWKGMPFAESLTLVEVKAIVEVVLNTLKTPTEGMIEAGIPHSPFKDRYMGGIVATGIFTAMIDHILSEHTEGEG